MFAREINRHRAAAANARKLGLPDPHRDRRQVTNAHPEWSHPSSGVEVLTEGATTDSDSPTPLPFISAPLIAARSVSSDVPLFHSDASTLPEFAQASPERSEQPPNTETEELMMTKSPALPILATLMTLIALPANSQSGPICYDSNAYTPGSTLPLYGTGDGGTKADIMLSYLSFIYPRLSPDPSTINYQVCNMNTDPLDLVWHGPNIAAGRGSPLPPGLCIQKSRSSHTIKAADTDIVAGLWRNATVTAPAYVDCDYERPSDFTYLVNSIRAFFVSPYDYPTPFTVSYSVYQDDNGNVTLRLSWWPSTLTVVAALDPSIANTIDRGDLEENGIREQVVDLNEEDIEVISLLNYDFGSSAVFWELQRDDEDRDEDDDDARPQVNAFTILSVPTSLSVANLQLTQMPVVIRSEDGQAAVIALFKGVAVSG